MTEESILEHHCNEIEILIRQHIDYNDQYSFSDLRCDIQEEVRKAMRKARREALRGN